MTFPRVNPASWSTGARFTSAQLNQLDTNVSNSVDGRVGALEIATRTGLIRNASDQGVPSLPANWARAGANWQCSTLGSGQSLYFKLRLPHGATLTSLTAYYQGAPGHAALPASMPVLRLGNQILSLGVVNLAIASATDPSANASAFETWHAITLSGLSYVVSRSTEALFATVVTEFGANAQPGPLVGTSILATFNVSRLDEG